MPSAQWFCLVLGKHTEDTRVRPLCVRAGSGVKRGPSAAVEVGKLWCLTGQAPSSSGNGQVGLAPGTGTDGSQQRSQTPGHTLGPGTRPEPPRPWGWDPTCVHFTYLSTNRFSNRKTKPKAPKAGRLRRQSGQKACRSSVLSGPCTPEIDRQLRNYGLAWWSDRLRAFRIILLAGDRKKMKVKCNLGQHCLGCLSRPGPEQRVC